MRKTLFNFLFVLIIFTMFAATGFAQTPPTEIEQAILDEINLARTDPQGYAVFLEDYKKLFNGNRIEYEDVIYDTREGVKAVDEAINFLKKSTKLEPFTLSASLSKVCKLHLNDLLENPELEHLGKDGSDLPKRLSRLGIKPTSTYAENISRLSKTPREIVMIMIIDDGVSSRGHRKNLFNKSFKQIGLAYGIGNNGEARSVMVLAGTFKENTK